MAVAKNAVTRILAKRFDSRRMGATLTAHRSMQDKRMVKRGKAECSASRRSLEGPSLARVHYPCNLRSGKRLSSVEVGVPRSASSH